MSLSRYKTSKQLDEDVLLMIFDHLDDQDLLRCATVCRQWLNVLLSQTPWRRLFHRQIVSCPPWHQFWRDFGVDEKKLQSANYRGICKTIIQELKKIYNNWRDGNFKKTSDQVVHWSTSYGTIGKNCIAFTATNYKKCLFFHRTSLKMKDFICSPQWDSFAACNTEIVVVWDEENIKILDTDGHLISEVQE
jgi:F-box-like